MTENILDRPLEEKVYPNRRLSPTVAEIIAILNVAGGDPVHEKVVEVIGKTSPQLKETLLNHNRVVGLRPDMAKPLGNMMIHSFVQGVIMREGYEVFQFEERKWLITTALAQVAMENIKMMKAGDLPGGFV